MEETVVAVPEALSFWWPIIGGMFLSPLAQFLKRTIPPAWPFRAMQIMGIISFALVFLGNHYLALGMDAQAIGSFVMSTLGAGAFTGIISQRISNGTGTKFLGNTPKTDWRGRPK